MRTLKHVLGCIGLGVIVWVILIVCAYNSSMFAALGIKGGYNFRQGQEGAIPFGIALMVAFGIDIVLNGVLGCCLAVTNPQHKTALSTVTALLILGVPILVIYGVYVADNHG